MSALDLNLLILDTHDLTRLAIADISTYPVGISVTGPTIEITPPSFLPVIKDFTINTINVFDAITLNISCSTCNPVNLPDGFWTVSYSVAPHHLNFVDITFFRVDQLRVKLDTLFLGVDIIENQNGEQRNYYKNQLDEIEYYLKGAQAAGNQCDKATATEFYNTASQMIDKFMKSKTCC